MPIRIVHISDPHFGAKEQERVWKTAAEHIRSLSPDLLLATGDLADSPRREFFDSARSELDGLQIPYLVVAGNHDRFPKGNNFLTSVTRRFSGPSEYFDQVFQRRVAVAADPAEFDLKSNGYQRRVRIIGLDSSSRADFFARGYVDPQQMVIAANAISRRAGGALNIALVHHHVLPVRSLEEAHRGKLSSLASVTTLVNAGSVLESFSGAQVSLVLHGHEHAFNCAFYASPKANRNETAVVAAGSITGNDSLEGCRIDRSAYNLFELLEDGTVALESRKWTGGDYTAVFSARLLSGSTVPRVVEFSAQQMLDRIKQSKALRMLIMRNEGFFRREAALLHKLIEERGLTLEVLLPDPGSRVLMEQLQNIYNLDARGLSASIVHVINLLREQIYVQLKNQMRLSVSLHQSYPLYSAYLFDDQELWYFPYHYRPNAPDKAPMFIYARANELAIYKDFRALNCKPVDLSQPFNAGLPN